MTIPAVGVSSLMLRLAAYRWFLLLFPLLLALAVGIKSMLSPPEFTAYARLLPPQANNTTASSLASQIGGNAVLGAAALTLKNPSDLYASLFLSRSVQDDVIESFNLTERYQESDLDVLRDHLAKNTRVEVGRDGIITLAFTDKTSEAAADIANGMIAAMYRIAKRLARNEAARRSEFYDVLIEEATHSREAASQRLLEIEKATGLTRLKGQEEASSATIVELQGLIATREVELRRMAVVATESHPEVQRVRSELAALRAQLSAISQPRRPASAPPSIRPHTQYFASAPRRKSSEPEQILLPFVSYAELRNKVEPLRREEEVANQMVEQLVKAKALSRVDESRDIAVISVLDAATPPTRKSGPRVVMNTVAAGLIGVLLAFLLALVWDVLFAQDARKSRWKQVFLAFTQRRA